MKGFRSFRDADFEPASHVNLLVGTNGAGKSTVLSAIYILLKYWISRRKSTHGAGGAGNIAETDIHNGINEAVLSLDITSGSSLHFWRVVKTRIGYSGIEKSDFSDLNRWIAGIRPSAAANATEGLAGSHSNIETSLPVFVHYSVTRAVLDIPERIRKHHDFAPLSVYEDDRGTGADFRRFFEWFRARQESENIRYSETADWSIARDRALAIVKSALSLFLPAFKNFRIRVNPLRMEVEKDRKCFSVSQLSDGEKSLIALVGDLASRCAIANPNADNPLLAEGIVMIDEVDLHLHPAWQMSVLRRFSETFPNIQFFFTSHSPVVLTSANNLLVTQDPLEKIANRRFQVWDVGNGAIRSLLDPETGLIGDNDMDRTTESLYDEFDQLSEQ